jgi:serine/threonine-protein kinase HipA
VKHLFVWMHGATGDARLVGELATTEPLAGGRFESEFEYAREWAEDPMAFSIDPVSLPLRTRGGRFRAEQFDPPLGVFDDALPDDWGRRLLTHALKLEGRKPYPPEMLLRFSGGGTGALAFSETRAPAGVAATVPATLQTRSLAALLRSATKFESGTLPTNDEFRQLLEGSSRVGGARPKALLHDDDGEWIAKFPSRVRDGVHDVVGLEATCLELARQAGLSVPDSRLQSVGRRRVLLVRRFDTTDHGGRIHMVSMRTLCKERPGVFVTSYGEMALVVGKCSGAPAADVASLFKHITFNAAIGNVDDHLKNFWMVADVRGYRLAPAFDLVPDTSGRGDHTLAFQYGFACPTRDALLAVADEWSVSNAEGILNDVTAAVGTFSETASKLRVRAGKSLEAVRTDIQQRLALIRDAHAE